MTTTNNDTTSNLMTLLSSTSFALAYALPLLLFSILITFSGAFFTLDRTRQFAPIHTILPGAYDTPKKKLHWRLEGGIGGLAIGYAFGVHFSTFLALLIPALSSADALSAKSFLAVWLLSSLLTASLAGRWKYCALLFAGIAGGTLFAIALSVVIHPSQLTRVIFVSICMPIVTIFCVLPLVRFQHASLRFAGGSMGAFGVVMSIAILADIPAWANVWERLWVSANIEWGTSKEKGMSAGFSLLFLAGMVCDFFLRKKFGECPDEKWDSYLAKYAANLPNLSDRAGNFKPFTSIWDRAFGTSEKPTTTLIFPNDKASSPLHTGAHDDTVDFQPSPDFLKKARPRYNEARFKARMASKKSREAVKFRPLDVVSSDSEEEGLDPQRPWLLQKVSTESATPTIVADYDSDQDVSDNKLDRVPEYSDYEEDLSSLKTPQRRDNDVPSFISRGISSRSSTERPTGAVPYTPSLIKALDRVAAAQKDAFSRNVNPTNRTEGLPLVPGTGENWDDFWKDVNEKSAKR